VGRAQDKQRPSYKLIVVLLSPSLLPWKIYGYIVTICYCQLFWHAVIHANDCCWQIHALVNQMVVEENCQALCVAQGMPIPKMRHDNAVKGQVGDYYD